MIRPALIASTAAAINYRAGNAQEFDGSFDYDVVNSYTEQDAGQAQSFFIEVEFNTVPSSWGGTGYLFNQGDGAGGVDQFGFQVLATLSPNAARIAISRTSSSRILAIFPNAFPSTGKYSCVLTYDGSSDISGLSLNVNGTTIAPTTQSNSLTGSITSALSEFQVGSRSGGNQKAQDVDIRRIEVINRVATAQEISDAITEGSFQGAGIAYGSGTYLLAIDFNSTNGNPPLIGTGTPSYTITANGGATYVVYE